MGNLPMRVLKYKFWINSIKEGIYKYKREFFLSSAILAWAYLILERIVKYHSLD
jgi:hypothetical protein